ncbi:GTP 3',8-cyclase MoaA [Acidocella sp.]|uniref:GTP 3',8-cyclase MoaA n=1 Tax=Acidocella sp. TaxID=50710 RepID=UPI00262AF1DF|nr:GTP 3',8-cyclase MoaA [Acidocella sp.]
MIDPFGRTISYLRVSVTDRCDFRCVYCMAEDMTFLPKAELLTLEELERLCAAFIRLGVKKLRFTGGEPLVRKGVLGLIGCVGARLGQGLEELTLTTNGAQLARHAAALRAAGVKRINVSLDTLDERKFAEITRWGRLGQVLEGIEAARAAGLAVKINMVAMRGVNEDEISLMLAWCGGRGFDLCLIETMPMGEVAHRAETHLPLDGVQRRLSREWTLTRSGHATGGPARYWDVAETGSRIGFITPLSNHFCDDCNRVRLTCTGTLYMCLGQDDAADLRAPLRASADDAGLEAAIHAAIARKPKGHEFDITRQAVARHMSLTGG